MKNKDVFRGDQLQDTIDRVGPIKPVSTAQPEELAILVGVQTPDSKWDVNSSLDELERLADTADVKVVGRITQRLATPDPRTFIGKGKLRELADMKNATGATVVLFDDELSPSQERNLEDELKCKIIDRSALILDIFARRARTKEGRLQVELAQLEYRLPRLTRMWTHLSRQGVGGVGLRGPGETQLEVDRRQSRERITHIKREIEQVRKHRKILREHRKAEGLPVVSLVGYTNAGKSTLLNKLAGADVLAEDKLFATLDPTTRQVRLPAGMLSLWTDTVGFIQKLPTDLVAAFRATLEEILEADVLVHVVDITHESAEEQAATVNETLRSLGAADKPTVVALNKIDKLAPNLDSGLPSLEDIPDNYVLISAELGWGIDTLLSKVEQVLEGNLKELDVLLPYSEGALVDLFHKYGQVRTEEFTHAGTHIRGKLPEKYVSLMRRYETAEARSGD